MKTKPGCLEHRVFLLPAMPYLSAHKQVVLWALY
jgi:hypothetical protein